MRSLTTARRSTASASGRLLGALVVVWVNMAVAPCAMALGGAHDCPHCPPAREEAAPAHHGHHADDVEVADDSRVGCDTLKSQCGQVEEFSVDGRKASSNVKDKSDLPVAIVALAPESCAERVSSTSSAVDPPPFDSVSPPLYILHCVFLD